MSHAGNRKRVRRDGATQNRYAHKYKVQQSASEDEIREKLNRLESEEPPRLGQFHLAAILAEDSEIHNIGRIDIERSLYNCHYSISGASQILKTWVRFVSCRTSTSQI